MAYTEDSPEFGRLKAPFRTGRVIIKIINKIMIVRIINRIICTNFSLRIDFFSNNIKNLKVLKSIVIKSFLFNK